MVFPEKDPLKDKSPLHSFNATEKLKTKTIISPTNADIYFPDSKIPTEYPQLAKLISSAKLIYQELLKPSDKTDFNFIHTEIKNLNEYINQVSESDLKLKRSADFVKKLSELRDNAVKLEQKTFLSGEKRKKVLLSPIKAIIKASAWGISGLDTDYKDFKITISNIEKEVKNTIESESPPVKKIITQVNKEQSIKQKDIDEKFAYLTNNPNEGNAKTTLGEEIVVSNKIISSFTSAGKIQYVGIIKTKIKNGGSRHIIKIGGINVAGVLFDENDKIIEKFMESYLDGTDIGNEITNKYLVG